MQVDVGCLSLAKFLRFFHFDTIQCTENKTVRCILNLLLGCKYNSRVQNNSIKLHFAFENYRCGFPQLKKFSKILFHLINLPSWFSL